MNFSHYISSISSIGKFFLQSQVEKLPYLKRFDFFLVFLRAVFHHSFSLFLCAHGELEIVCEEAFTLKIEAH